MRVTPLLFLTANQVANGFIIPSSSSSSLSLDTIRSTTALAAAAKKKGNIELPPNEFSRPLRTDTILGPRRRTYNIELSAKNDELDALAKRFSLSNISKLEADLVLKRDQNTSNMSGSGTGECIQVSGSIIAEVTQTCVRTNEDFEVDLEFEISSLVKSSGTAGSEEDEYGSSSSLGGMSLSDIEGSINGGSRGGGGGRSSSRKKGKKRRGGKGSNSRESGSLLSSNKMKELQDLLQDFDVDEDIVEDESIFGTDGIIDVGELIAQSFRLKLDPYPKKPGSEPVNYSITG